MSTTKDVDTTVATVRPSTHGADPIAGAAPLLPDLQAAPSPRSLDNSGGDLSPGVPTQSDSEALAAVREMLRCSDAECIQAEIERLLDRDRDADLYGDALMALSARLPGRFGGPLDAEAAIGRVLGVVNPGDVLRAEDFGDGDAALLRFAALLVDAPDGSVVQDEEGCEWTKRTLDDDCGCSLCESPGPDSCGKTFTEWHPDGGFGWHGGNDAGRMTSFAPLTVIEWPAGGES